MNKDKKDERMQSLLKKGKWSYIIKFGFLFWGLTSAFIALLIKYFIFGDSMTIKDVSYFISFPLAGVFWGMYMWRYMLKNTRETSEE